MRSVRMKGRNVEEAVEAALAVLGVSKNEVDVKIISEGKAGVLGVIGTEEAEVEVVAKGSIESEASQILQNILDRMGFLAMASVDKIDEGEVFLVIRGEDIGRIIGKEGSMLDALETIVSAIVSKMFGQRVRIHIDAGGYRAKRIRALERLAEDAASEVAATGKEKILPYMPADDRRIIHLYLSNHDKVKSYSQGEGRNRRLIIAPR